MNPAIIAIIEQIILELVKQGPAIIKDVQDTRPFAEAIVNTISGKTPTQADIISLEAQLTSLSNQLQAPLPPDDDA